MNKNLVFQQLFDSESSTFTYLLADSRTKEAVLIDTVLENLDRDLKLITELELHLKYVLDTHIHADHVTAAGQMRKRCGVLTAVPKKANVPCADLNLSEGDEIKFGEFVIKVLETPGHTDASLSFYCEDMLFSGDALLIRGTGRTDFQSGSSEELYKSITEKLFQLPAETRLYPAHDYKGFTSSSIGAEIKHNPRLGAGKSQQDFIKIMSELKLSYPKKINEALPANNACGSKDVKALDPRLKISTIENLKSRADDILIVDVRRPDEYVGEQGHIQGSRLVTLGEDLTRFLESYNRSEEIIFVCHSGTRSAEAAQLALQMGFEKVSFLDGGMLHWNKAHRPV